MKASTRETESEIRAENFADALLTAQPKAHGIAMLASAGLTLEEYRVYRAVQAVEAEIAADPGLESLAIVEGLGRIQ